MKKLFLKNEIDYDARKKLLYCKGPRDIHFNLTYKGADDKIGPNYTGQDAVDSYYTTNTGVSLKPKELH